MRKAKVSFLFICLMLAVATEAGAAISSEKLLQVSEKYDGKEIFFKGEVIGDILGRGESVWINVRDKYAAIGIFCSRKLTERIKYMGSYKVKGDIISVRGVFHRACIQHGGDTDIHANKITIINGGEKIKHVADKKKIKAAMILPAIAFFLAMLHLIVRRFR